MPTFVEVARQTLVLQLRGRLYLAMVALSVVFSCMFLFLPPRADWVRGDELFDNMAYFIGFMTMIPFVTLFLSAQAVRGDIEDRLSVFLFTRPVHRASLLVGKWLAVIALGVLFVTVAITALYSVIALSGRGWRHDAVPSVVEYQAMLFGGWLAVMAYAAVGCFLSAFFRRPLVLGVLYIMLEQFASRLPPQVAIHNATVAFPTRALIYQNGEPSEEMKENLVGVIDDVGGAVKMIEAVDPILALLKLTGIAMVLALFVYTRREYDSRPRE